VITQVVKRTMKRRELSILLSLLVVVSGCSTFTRRPVPESLIDSVCVPHMPRDIRTWGDPGSNRNVRPGGAGNPSFRAGPSSQLAVSGP